MPSAELKGRVALVTGAGVRLGRALAEGLAGRGMRLALHYNRHRPEAEALATRIRAARPQDSLPAADCFPADLEDPCSAAPLVAGIETSFGPIDVLVLSAATYPRESLASIEVATLESTLRINLTSPFLLAKEVGIRMRKRGSGRILAILDWSLDRPYPDRLSYTIAKAGLRAGVLGLARALAPEVRVNAIAPGAILLPDGTGAAMAEKIRMAAPLQCLGTPDDLVGAALFVLESRFLTGVILPVDGGRSVV
jgi:pteridine reductase